MKIGINLLSLVPRKIGGMEQYIRNLIWYSVNQSDDYKLYLFLSSGNIDTFDENNHKMQKILIQEEVDKNIQLYKWINDLKLDVWFCPLLTLDPKFVNIPTVVTIPDIQHEFYPEFFNPEILEWRKRFFEFSALKSNAILTLSEFSKRTIVDKYSVPSDKVHAIHLDSTKEFCLINNEDLKKKIAIKYKLPERYGFYPANTWTHKNHISLLKAIVILRENYNCKINLVLTGSENQAHNPIREFIRKNDLTKQVKFIGYIPQEDMPYIYLNSSFMVFPSLFEGFGIPLVEAMRTKTPIVCSNSGSIPEVVEDCALFFDPTKPEDIALKIIEIQDEKVKEGLIHKGIKHAENFSWEKSSKDTLKLFNGLVNGQKDVSDYPLVSIVTPSFNQGKFIKETIDSVLSQDYPNIEYIVMDGGSSDNTVDILKSYGDKIKWISQQDDGQADAVNKGIQIANGEIIGWLNSDDTYLPGAIKEAIETLMHHKELGMVYGEGYHTTENGEIIERYPTESFNYNRLAETCFVCQPTAFIRKRVLEEVGFLDKELQLCMDYELWMKIGKEHEIGYIPQFLATSRMYQDNKTLSRRNEVYKEIMHTVKKYYNYVPISWIYGYVDYLLKGKRRGKFLLFLLFYCLKYNIDNLPYFFEISKNLVVTKLKQKLKNKIRNRAFTERYEDGWVSKIYSTSLNIGGQSEKIKIKGKHLWPFRNSLKIKVNVNGKHIKTFKIVNKGEFEIEFDLAINPNEETQLQFITNRTFIPRKFGINGDIRELAYIIDKIEIRLLKESTYDEVKIDSKGA